MLSKALWYKNYKQSKFACWAFIVFSLILPFNVYSQERELEYIASKFPPLPDGIYVSFFPTAFLFQMIVLVILAAILIGAERNNYHYEFSLALPVTRKSIFLSKWMIGVLVILSGVTLSVLLALFQYGTSEYLKEYISPSLFLTYWLVACVLLTAIYSFSLMIGYMTGNLGSQVGLSLISLVLPGGLYHLIHQFFVHHYIFFQHTLWWRIREFSELATLPIVLLGYGQYYAEKGITLTNWVSTQESILIALGYIVITFLVTLWLSKRSKVEHHGKILLFKPLEHVLKIGVFVCFFLLGGFMIGDSMRHANGSTLLSYYIGGLVFASIAYFILAKLLQLKLSFRKS